MVGVYDSGQIAGQCFVTIRCSGQITDTAYYHCVLLSRICGTSTGPTSWATNSPRLQTRKKKILFVVENNAIESTKTLMRTARRTTMRFSWGQALLDQFVPYRASDTKQSSLSLAFWSRTLSEQRHSPGASDSASRAPDKTKM